MTELNISFIGAGNMAHSLIGGMIADGRPASTIWASDPNQEQLNQLHQQLEINIASSNSNAVEHADIIVLAIKPQNLKVVAEEIKPAVQAKKPLVISVAAGIQEQDINRWLGGEVAIVRTMPNTPALIQAGATALYANPLTTPSQKESAETIMRTVGLTIWVDQEAQMDVVTALSGSGPAYYFLFIESMTEAAHHLGLPKETARLLALQTAFGAAKMALESEEDCTTLRKRVTSPGGTTEQALKTFEEGALRDLVHKALAAATDRSKELAQQLGG